MATGSMPPARLLPGPQHSPVLTAHPGRPTQAVRLLQLYAVVLLVIPSDIVIKAIGGAAFPAGLIGMFAFLWWLVASLFGLHDPRRYPNPARLSLLTLWIATLASYIAVASALPIPLEMRAADRWVMQLVAWTGVAIVAAESIDSLDDFRAVLRALAWGGAICGTVAALQFWVNLDLAVYLRWIPGFSLNSENTAISSRFAQNRVAGTAIHPIELGVVMATLLPLAVVSALHDPTQRRSLAWLRVVLIGVAIPVSVSRSAILAMAVSMLLLICSMVPRRRVLALMVVPVALVGIFMSAPGLIGTLRDFFFLGSRDSSIAVREQDVPMVEHFVRQAPWFGRGGGTYLPTTQVAILDNQYYRMFIELGLVGTVLVTAGYLVAPPLLAFAARKRCTSEASRLLGAALGGSAAVAVLVTFTFDSLGFPMYAGLQALIVGMIGAYWRLARREESARPRLPNPHSHEDDPAAAPPAEEGVRPAVDGGPGGIAHGSRYDAGGRR